MFRNHPSFDIQPCCQPGQLVLVQLHLRVEVPWPLLQFVLQAPVLEVLLCLRTLLWRALGRPGLAIHSLFGRTSVTSARAVPSRIVLVRRRAVVRLHVLPGCGQRDPSPITWRDLIVDVQGLLVVLGGVAPAIRRAGSQRVQVRDARVLVPPLALLFMSTLPGCKRVGLLPYLRPLLALDVRARVHLREGVAPGFPRADPSRILAQVRSVLGIVLVSLDVPVLPGCGQRDPSPTLGRELIVLVLDRAVALVAVTQAFRQALVPPFLA